MFYRVADSERFPSPISDAATIVPQITPIFAVPVLNRASDFRFQPPGSNTNFPLNPHNDYDISLERSIGNRHYTGWMIQVADPPSKVNAGHWCRYGAGTPLRGRFGLLTRG